MKEKIIELINDILESKSKGFLFKTRCERICIILNNNNLLKNMANNLDNLLKEKNDYVYLDDNYKKILFLLEEIKKELKK